MFKQDMMILSIVIFIASLIPISFSHVGGIIPALIVSVTLGAVLALSLKAGRKIIGKIRGNIIDN